MKGSLALLLAAAAAVLLGLPAGTQARVDAGSHGSRCPRALLPGRNAAEGALAAVRGAVPMLYRGSEYRAYEVTSLASLRPRAYALAGAAPFRAIAARRCGKRVAARSWAVLLLFPRLLPSASLSQGVVFAARTPRGWRVWHRYR